MEIVLENNRAASTVFILLTFVCLHLPSSLTLSLFVSLGTLVRQWKAIFLFFGGARSVCATNQTWNWATIKSAHAFSFSLSLSSSNSALQSVFHFFLRRLNERVKLYEASCGSSGSSSSDLLSAFSLTSSAFCLAIKKFSTCIRKLSPKVHQIYAPHFNCLLTVCPSWP